MLGIVVCIFTFEHWSYVYLCGASIELVSIVGAVLVFIDLGVLSVFFTELFRFYVS